MNPRELVREVLGVVLLGLGVFLLASLLSFDVGDLPARVAPARPDPVNLGGRVGVALAAQLLLWVGNLGGLAACLIVLLFAGSCLRRVAAASPEGAAPVAPRAGVEPLRRVMGGLIVVLTASVLERILAGTPWGGLLVRHGCAAGGYWGMFLESELSRLLGGAGSSIALGVVLSVGLVLCTDRTLAELLGRSVDGARVAAAKAADGVIAAEAALASVAPEAQEALVEAGPLEAVDPTDPEPARWRPWTPPTPSRPPLRPPARRRPPRPSPRPLRRSRSRTRTRTRDRRPRPPAAAAAVARPATRSPPRPCPP